MRRIALSDEIDVYEQQPSYRTVRLYTKNMYLYFPYIVYIVRRDSASRLRPFRKVQTLHVGLRTEPLDRTPLEEQILLTMPLPNCYASWLLVCCSPTIRDFWESTFNEPLRWPCEEIFRRTPLKNMRQWECMPPAAVMEVFRSYPESIEFPYNDATGLFDGSRMQTLYTKVFLADALADLPSDALVHIEQMSARDLVRE